MVLSCENDSCACAAHAYARLVTRFIAVIPALSPPPRAPVIEIVSDSPAPKPTKAPKQFDCDACGRSFTKREYLRQHMGGLESPSNVLHMHAADNTGPRQVHTGNWRFRCDYCGKGCLNKSHLEIHVDTHRRNDEKLVYAARAVHQT